jgi:signal transduction histidine kinase/CheY-like chemotaxis protein/CHASE3 domain sensor protein
MKNDKNNIPVKILVGYLVLATLFVGVAWFLYSQNKVFSENENTIAQENGVVLKVSSLLSNMYKTESWSRVTIQTNSETDFKKYISQTDSLKTAIDAIKLLVKTPYQKVLLDSVKQLLTKKIKNIRQLKSIKSRANEDVAVKVAIKDLTKMQDSLRKLKLEDFVKNPAALGAYQLGVLKKYVTYLNQNIPDDSSNTLTKKASDSILKVSKNVLKLVELESTKRKKATHKEEKKLLQNELLISEQLRKILNLVEREIIKKTKEKNLEKQRASAKINTIVTSSAIIGLLISLFFAILILNDFSKAQSYKLQLQVANAKTQSLLQSREQLIATVSHDLKTPLSTIMGYTELLTNSSLTEKQTHFAKNIKVSSEYISKLVNDLLDFTQLEAHKLNTENIPFSLKEIVELVARTSQSRHFEKPIDLLLEIAPEFDKKIIGDPFRLRQILENLIGNAFKFTEKGFIKITAQTATNNTLLIKIEDTGIGIAKENQLAVFEEFTQANATIEKKYGGTGLGLTISKKMIQVLGGNLSLKSELKKGSLFEIWLPLLFIKTTEYIQQKPKEKKQFTAIVVDDDTNLLALTATVLRQNNFIVFEFNTASKALNCIKNNPFDVVITDLQMPQLDGFQFIEKLQNTPKYNYKNQPLIAITGKVDLDLAKYKKAGFTEVIYKPYSPKKLVDVLNQHLNKIETKSLKLPENQTKALPYSLDSLREFLGNNHEDLKTFLASFIKTTQQNLSDLNDAITQDDTLRIKEISHKMYPVFRQIQAQEISTILYNLDTQDFSNQEIKNQVAVLEKCILVLFEFLKKQ